MFIGISLLAWVASSFANEPAPDLGQIKRVAVLYSEPLDFPATVVTERGIREALLNNTTFHVQMFAEYLDLSRFRDLKQRNALASLLEQRYAKEGTDLIISVDVPAANFLLERAESALPGIPIIMCSISEVLRERLETSPLRKRTCAVFEPANGADFVKSALSLKPNVKHAVLITGAFENDELRAADLRKTLQALGNRLQLLDLAGLSIGNLIESVRKLPPDAVIFYSTFFVDGNGRSFVPREVLKIISDQAPVPVFGPYEQYLGYGIVGGSLTSLGLQGKKAGEMAIHVLQGESPSAIPFDYGEDTCITAFDWRQLQR
jgi:ABC-type uncharacterized transport system substrate-binding protein